MSFLLHKFRQKEVREKMKTQEEYDFEEIIAGFTKRHKKMYFPFSNYGGLHYKSQSSGATKKIKVIKEKRLSSINFQKAKKYSYSHNFREEDEKKEAKYLLPEEYHQENEYWFLSDENGEIKSAGKVFLEEVKKTKRKGGVNPKFENAHREAVIVLNSHHTMEDLHKVREHFEKNYKFICCAIAIHRDEGYLVDIKGEKVPKYNYHAHLNFITYANGGQQWNFNKKQLADMQTEISEILGMERGEVFSKTKRLAHQHYRYVKEQEDKLRGEKELVLQQNAELSAKNQELEIAFTNQSKRKKFWGEYRQKLIDEGGYTQQDYQFIRAIIMDNENDYKSVIKAIEDYKELKNARERQSKAIVELQDKIAKIEAPLKEKLANKEQELALEKEKSSEAIKNTTQEIKSLKIENNSLKNEIEILKKAEPEIITITKEKEVIKEIIPSFEEIKQNLTYEQKQEIAEPFVKVWRGMKQEAEEQRDKFYNEKLELQKENKALYEARGYKDTDLIEKIKKKNEKIQNLELELEEVKKTPQNHAPQIVQPKITEEQKQEIIAPYKEKIDFLEKVIQSFHNLLVKLKIKPSNSNIYEVPQLQQPQPKQERMCPQRRAELERGRGGR